MVRFGDLEATDDLQKSDFMRAAVSRVLLSKLEVKKQKCVVYTLT